MNIIRLGIFDETGVKFVKKVDAGFFNPNGVLASALSLKPLVITTIDGIDYSTVLVNNTVNLDAIKDTFSGGSNISDLFNDNSNKIFVMKNEKEKTENFLQVITTETQYSGITYFIGDNRVNQEATLTLPVANSTIKMGYYYRIVNNVLKEFIGWLYLAPTGQIGPSGQPTYRISGVLVDLNFWEKGKVPPFGDPTPGGAIGGYGTYDDTSDNFPIPPNRLNDVYGSILSNQNGKIQMYTLDSGAYGAFLGKIYTNDFWQYWKNTIFNPLDGIYSCIRVPFSELELTRSAVAKINVSNTELEILAGAYKVTNNYVKDQLITSNYVIDEYFGSFLDYSPYTTCELFIPFYGTVNLDINEIMGGSVSITRRNNYVNGDFIVFVQCTNRFGITVTHSYAGNAAITLPITAGNDGSPNRILDLVQGVTNLAMGNYVGAGTSAVNALTEKGTTTTIQKLSGNSGWSASHDFALIFRRSCPSNPENYTKENGRQADEFVNFSDLQGYTEVSAVDLKFTSGKITSAEIDEINNLLKQGVFF